MSNVETIKFLINEANQLTADTPKKVRQYTIDLLAKAAQEAAGSTLAYVEANVWIGSHGRVIWNILCPKDNGYCTPYVRLMSEPLTNVGVSSIVISTWDNAAEIFVKAIDILAEDGAPHIPAIRESFKVANTPEFDPPKFDPEQAIWDAGGWGIPESRSVSIVGECTKAYIEYGGMGYIAERDPDLERVLTSIGPIKNPRHVDTDRFKVIVVLPNRVYVAKRNGTGSWAVFTKDSITSGTVYYCYSSAVKDAIKFSQETS